MLVVLGLARHLAAGALIMKNISGAELEFPQEIVGAHLISSACLSLAGRK